VSAGPGTTAGFEPKPVDPEPQANDFSHFQVMNIYF
jgi:hypothetical protein